MKTKPRRFPVKHLMPAYWAIIAATGLFISTRVFADGGFVVPKFVWDKQKDINEPTQKAIIAYDSGREDLLLQVKYDGPVEEFGWLVPVPSVPKVQQASMKCFYEISKFTQRKFEFEHESVPGTLGIGGAEEKPPEVKVIEVKTVGAYQVAVLSTKEAGALENWLGQNGFSIPGDKAGIIDFYAKRGWFFVAARINLNKPEGFEFISGTPKASAVNKTRLAEKLSSGELNPLHLSFATDKCVFPLKISSMNGRPSEVQVYVLSKEPLVEKGMFQQNLADQHQWHAEALERFERMESYRSGRRASLLYPQVAPLLMMRTSVNLQDVIPYAEVDRQTLPACAKALSLPDYKIWLMKQTWTFTPDKMRDLEFEPAIPVFSAAIAEQDGSLAAANLSGLGHRGVSAMLAATGSSDSRTRANAISAVDNLAGDGTDSTTRKELMPRLPALLKDPDPEVRYHALNVSTYLGDTRFFSQAVDLLRDDNPEVAQAALGYLGHQRTDVSKYIPMFKQMLRDTNSMVQLAGLRFLFNNRIEIPREELVRLLSVPRSEVSALAYQILGRKGLSDEEAGSLLQNPESMIRMIGLVDLAHRTNSQVIGMMIPMMKDPEVTVRTRAHDLLVILTGQTFAIDAQDQWKQWWAKNKSTFVMDQNQMDQRRLDMIRQRREAALSGLRPPPGP